MAGRDMSRRAGVDIGPNRDVVQEGTEKLSNCPTVASRRAWTAATSGHSDCGLGCHFQAQISIRPISSYGIPSFRRISFRLINFHYIIVSYCFHSGVSVLINSMLFCSRWPRGLRHELSSPAPTLGSWVRIPLRHGCLCVFCVRFFCVYVVSSEAANRPNKRLMRTYHWISLFMSYTKVSKLAYRIWVILIANERVKEKFCSRYSDCLRAGRPRDQSSSSDRVKNFHLFVSSWLALGPTQPRIQWVPGLLHRRKSSRGVKLTNHIQLEPR
jgi:hypothetical protein